jgi:D-alanyl-D-alanine endopeptidase (penicillin-binding protein 7)
MPFFVKPCMFKKFFYKLFLFGLLTIAFVVFIGGSALVVRILQVRYPQIRFPILSAWFPFPKSASVPVKKEDRLPESKILSPRKKGNNDFQSVLTAQSVVVVDDATGVVLWSKNSADTRPLASISKLMAMLVLSDLHLDMSMITIVTSADSDGTSSQVRVGERYTLGNLWEASLVGSSNMAVRALVRSAGFTDEQFAERMNAKARELQLFSFYFAEPTGLSSKNVGTAEDVVRLLKVALACDAVYNALVQPSCAIEPIGAKGRQVWSTNMLLTDWVANDFKRAQAVGKTGHIEDSGYNFVVRLSRSDGRAIRVAVLDAASNELRFSEARDIGEWVFENYMWPEEEGYRGTNFK